MGPSRVSLTGETLQLAGTMGGASTDIPVGAIDSITIRPSWFRHRLTIRLGDGTQRSIDGLDGEEAARVRDGAVAAAGPVARALAPKLRRPYEQARRLFLGDKYARHGECREFHRDLASVLRECNGLVREHLDGTAGMAVDRLARFGTIDGLEAARERANNLFVCRSVATVRTTSQQALGRPLTEEQAGAVVTDEDVTLVLAGAGTGKTSVIVGKIAHLVYDQGVSPDSVLALAFNRKAAHEIRERLKGDLSAVHVETFHGFGSRVIKESGVASTISKLAEDELALKLSIDTIVGELLNDPEQSWIVVDFIANHRAPYRSAFDFDTYDDYEEYVRSVELRTLSGALVKSFEELQIANYLTVHGVEFRYEEPYEIQTATRQHRQYQPDFFLPGHDIYIEHFALDREGHPPPGWKGYAKGVEWKRGIHARRGTTLVETYSWQHRQGVLLPTLRTRLQEAGVPFVRVPTQALVQRLANAQTSWLAGLLGTFLNHVKGGCISAHELRARVERSANPRRCEAFLAVFEQVHERYQGLLTDRSELDFHDLINCAAERIRAGRWKSEYRHILVDEFQDISAGRMALIQALKRRDVAYFLVGDDWQSIYRFAGSDVGIIHRCDELLGHVRQLTLSRTFRFAKGILGPSTAFVRRNPEQTQRALLAASRAEDEGVTVIADHDPRRGLDWALRDIESRAGGRQRTVLVLARYRKSLEDCPAPARSGSLSVEFSTVHRAKGREADHVVVLDLKRGRWGFPSQVEDDPLLELVLTPVLGGAYPFAEERRLLYVAMTRARIGAYLIVDPMQPSPFVEELLEERDGLRLIGELSGQVSALNARASWREETAGAAPSGAAPGTSPGRAADIRRTFAREPYVTAEREAAVLPRTLDPRAVRPPRA